MKTIKSKIFKLIVLVLVLFGLHPQGGYSQNQNGYPSNNMQSPNSNNNGYSQNNGLGNNGFGNSNFGNSNMQNNGNDTSSRRQKQRASQRTSRRDTNSNTNGSETPSLRRTKTPRQVSPDTAAPRVDSNTPTSSMTVIQSKSGQTYTGKSQDIPKPNVPTINTLYLDAKNTNVVVNEPFVVTVKLNIGKEILVDSISFVLSYDTDLLLPVQGKSNTGEWVPADSVTTQAADSEDRNNLFTEQSDRIAIEENKIDTSEGRIVFSASAPQTVLRNNVTIAQLTFVPLQTSDRTSIEFSFAGTEAPDGLNLQTSLLHQEEDLLGTKANPSDGVVPLRLRITDSTSSDEPNKKPKPRKENPTDKPVKLSLISEHTAVDVGDTFEVQVQLGNPDQKALDSVSLLILFNPQVLQVVDSTPSSSGVNIDDQVNPAQFPFDFDVLNRVDNDKGIIDYRKKALKTNVRGTGHLATIQFRALQATSKTEFRILIHETGQYPTTGVTYKNHDVLGSSQDITDGIASTSVSIRAKTAYLN